MVKGTQINMGKKGQIFEVLGIIVIIGIAIFGASTIYYQKESLFIVDKSTGLVYAYGTCKMEISKLPKANLLVFQDAESAKSQGYEFIVTCKNGQ